MPAMQIWEPGSTITLYRVPWDSNYQDVVQFDSEDARDEYFESLDGLTIDVESSVFCYPGKPITIDVPYTSAFMYNYCVVKNPYRQTVPVTPRLNWYYFIVSLDQRAPQPVTLTLQLDVWTQYNFTTEYGVGYLERGHLPFVNEPCRDMENIPKTLNRYFNIPEEISNGTEFQPYVEIATTLQADDVGTVREDCLVIVSTASLTEDPGTIDAPKLTSSEGGFFGGVFSGSRVYVVKGNDGVSSIESLFKAFSSYPWISQCIVSITCVPWAIIGPLIDEDSAEAVFAGKVYGDCPDVYTLSTDGQTVNEAYPVGEIDMRVVTDYGWDGVEGYKDLAKLWTYPYSVVEVTNGQNSVFLMPQLLPQNKTELRLFSCAVAPFLEAAVVPWGYGRPDPDEFTVTMTTPRVESSSEVPTVQTSLPFGDLLNSALWFNDFPQWSIINNNAILSVANNAYNRAYSYDLAAYNRDLAGRQIDLSNTQFYRGQGVERQNMFANTVYKMGRNFVNMGLQGLFGHFNPTGGAITGVVNSGLDAIGNAVDAWTFLNSQEAAATSNDENVALATWAADRSNENAIKSIEAGVATAMMTPPSSVGNQGGQGLRYVNGLTYSVIVKYERINPTYVAKVGDFFKRFGYSVNRYVEVPDSMRLMDPCTYWKFAEIYIENALADETSKNALRGILLNGVTVWNDPTKIGRVRPVDITPIEETVGTYYS